MTNINTTDQAELLAEFDLFNDDHFAQMPEAMEYARGRCPVAHTSAHGGMYMVTTYDELQTVLSDPETFSSVESSPLPSPVRLPPLDVDPPLHGQFRKLLNKFFSRPYLRKFEDELQSLAREAVDSFVDRGEVDFVQEFAIPFTSAAAAKVVFDEDDKDKLGRAVSAVERIVRENSPESYQSLAILAGEYLAERAETGGDSIIAAIARGTVDDRPLTQEEQIGIITTLFIGGLDTTRGAIANLAAAVAQDSSLEEIMRQPDWVNNDLDEFLRHTSPVLALRRLVTRDTVLGGQQLRKGDIIMNMYASANRDKNEFPDADNLNFEEHHRNHLAFGHGPHRCMGQMFARMQIRIAFEEILSKVTNLRVAGPNGGPDYEAGAVYAPKRLILNFDRVGE
jgi:cytochrome P450